MSQPSLASNFIRGLFSLDGRMTRSDFWVTTVALSVAAVLLSIVLSSTIRLVSNTNGRIILTFLVIQVLIAWPGFAISVKRGHDRGYSAWRTFWLNVISHLVPIALIVVPLVLQQKPQWQGAFWVFAVLTVYMTVDYGILEGVEGANKYGPSPKGAIRV